ncbi:MAG TPA: ABC transporter substrate-binding protein [Candidatus Paceibacterota bacterium]
MKNLWGRMRQLKIFASLPSRSEINSAFSTFSKREWKIFSVLTLVLLVSTLAILQNINSSFMVSVPMRGGSVNEGIIGTPRFINPILANSPADQDLVSIIYSGLLRKGADGKLIPDLAEKYEISTDGLTYTFTLKKDLYFQDNTPLSVDDIIFTIDAVKDPVIKSPRKGSWDGVSVEKIDDLNIKFTLKQPYASFLENTTLGIMPMHIWSGSPVELNEANVNPIGSGPYMVKSVSKQSSGVIDSYELARFDKFILGKPYIKNINLYFYSSEEDLIAALENKTVDQVSSLAPENAKLLKDKEYRVESSVLPRVFGLFFNQNQNQLFTNKNIITAVGLAIDKDSIVSEVLSGYGVAIDDPIPPNMIAYQKLSSEQSVTREENLRQAKEILTKDGWKMGESGFLEKTKSEKGKKDVVTVLEFSISTGNAPELVKSATLIQENLALLGMKVDVRTFEVGNLNQGVIRPRKYDALLFGQIINNESDLYAFWHSSQRKDPGLNVAMYTNAKVDKILEDAFVTVDEQARIKKYAQFEDEIKKDMPAVFLYSPNFLYIVSKDLSGLSMDHIISPRDRFLNIYLWYTEVDNIWKIFTN